MGGVVMVMCILLLCVSRTPHSRVEIGRRDLFGVLSRRHAFNLGTTNP